MPVMSLGIDFGSDGVRGIHGMRYLWHMNAEAYPDGMHADTRSVWNGLNKTALWPLVLLGLISWNLPHGPEKEYWRQQQLKTHSGKLYEVNPTPRNVPLFKAYAPRIILAFKKLGVQICDQAPEYQAWEWMKDRHANLTQGSNIGIARFGAVSYALKVHNPLIPMVCFERTYVGLEVDALGNKMVI